MAQTVWIINNEGSPAEMGWVPAGTLSPDQSGFYLTKNLVQVIKTLWNYEVQVLHHQTLSSALATQPHPQAMIFSGRWTPWALDRVPQEYQQELDWLVSNHTIPCLGICAGHQLMGAAYGAAIAPMGDGVHPISELGNTSLSLRPDPLFEGLGETIQVNMLHLEELKELPDQWICLGSTSLCQYAAIRHTSKPMWGVQFHPELPVPPHNAGLSILKNFLQLSSV